MEQFYEKLPVLESEDKPFSREERLKAIGGPLLSWYGEHARILPWREHPGAYQVWISEIMLQQTRVEAVKPYFFRFMEELPDVKALAQVEEQKLLKLWEGLGYYNRARNLKKAAKIVMEEYGGILPASYEELLTLPGIGNYTAGAIASIAYGISVPAVDGNVLRVISRVLADREDIGKASVRHRIWDSLKASMPKGRAGDFNQGLMEIGAMVCVPNGQPKCRECPLESVCLAGKKGLWDGIPCKTPKKPRRVEERTILLIQSGQQIAIEKRPGHGLLASLYQFPNYEGRWKQEEVVKFLEERCGEAGGTGCIKEVVPAGEAKHIFSHVEWHMTGYWILTEAIPSAYLSVEKKELFEKYPLPNAFCAYTKLLHGES